MSTLKQFQDYGLPNPNANNKEAVQKNINYLYDKLSTVSKTLTYWDLYKITEVVTDKKNLQSITNSLLPFTSAIINTPTSFQEGTETYAVGDVVLKQQDGSIQHIQAERGGIFFPYKITKTSSDASNYNYTIDYQLKSHEPNEGSQDVEGVKGKWDTSGKYYKNISYENLTGGAGVSPYNNVQFPSDGNLSFEFDVAYLKGTETEIRPIIKCYNDNGEEVYCDFTCAVPENETQWEFSMDGVKIVTQVVVK